MKRISVHGQKEREELFSGIVFKQLKWAPNDLNNIYNFFSENNHRDSVPIKFMLIYSLS